MQPEPKPFVDPVEVMQAQLKEMSTEHLRGELSQAMQLSVRHIIRAAACLRELKRRGEDVSKFSAGIGRYVAHVASGNLLPDVLVELASLPCLVEKLAKLPHDVQRDVLANKPIPMMTTKPAAKGAPAVARVVDVKPSDMTVDQVKRVFDTKGIVPPERQRPEEKSSSGKLPEVKVDHGRGGIYVGKVFIGLVQLETFVAILKKKKGAAA